MSIKNIFSAQILTNTNDRILFHYLQDICWFKKKIYLRQIMNLFKSCTSKINTVWMGLDIVYGIF